MHGHTEHENSENPTNRVNRRPLAIALAITTVFLVAEVIGGLLTNSLALLADAGHMVTDVAALALALFATWLAQRPATPERSFGFYRAEILAALVNAASLVAISIYIFWEAWQPIGKPPEVDSGPMLVVAIAGLGANAASAWVLARRGARAQPQHARRLPPRRRRHAGIGRGDHCGAGDAGHRLVPRRSDPLGRYRPAHPVEFVAIVAGIGRGAAGGDAGAHRCRGGAPGDGGDPRGRRRS